MCIMKTASFFLIIIIAGIISTSNGHKQSPSHPFVITVHTNTDYDQDYGPVKYNEELDYHDTPKYEFKYGIEDPLTGDFKTHEESRDGDVVKGQYSMLEADGTVRVVKYTADKHTGFNAIVTKEHPHLKNNRYHQ